MRSPPSVSDSVLYTEQELTEDQQSIARNNIRAASETSVTELSEKIADYETLTLGYGTDGKLYIFKKGSTIGNGIEIAVSGDTTCVIDEDNNLIISGAPNGSYTMKYQYEDGTYSDSISVVVSDVPEPEPEPTYTNILTSSNYDIKLDQRWSNSNGGFTSCTGMISLVIPITDVWNKTIYFKRFTKDIKSNNAAPIWMTIKDSTRVNSLASSDTTGDIWKAKNLIIVDEANGIYAVKIDTSNFAATSTSTADSLVINMAVYAASAISTTLPSGLIMTIDEEII